MTLNIRHGNGASEMCIRDRGVGYDRWAAKHNLKQMAATVTACLLYTSTYTKQGDYLIPYITIRQPRKALGHYGRLRKAYLQNFRPILFNELVLSDMLFEHCLEIEETARNQIDVIMSGLMKQYGITEELKAENQMEWVRQMNACKAQAEEVVKAELIYN